MTWVIVFGATALALALYFYITKRPRVSAETKLAITKYENFGHDFSIADLVTSILKKAEKPPFTNWTWNTFLANAGKYGEERMLRVQLNSQLDSKKATYCEISLEESNDYRYNSKYSDVYIESKGIHKARHYDDKTVKELIAEDIKNAARGAGLEFQREFKDTEFGSDLSGVV